MNDDVDTTQKTLGVLVNKVAKFIDAECNSDIQLMVAVARDFLFQSELAYRCGILNALEKKKDAKTE